MYILLNKRILVFSSLFLIVFSMFFVIALTPKQNILSPEIKDIFYVGKDEPFTLNIPLGKANERGNIIIQEVLFNGK